MFYCEDCRRRNQWPKSPTLSAGNCEVCGFLETCYDTPSKLLPNTEKPDTFVGATFDGHLLDITGPTEVYIDVREDGNVLWVNVDGICRLRICRIKKLVVGEDAVEKTRCSECGYPAEISHSYVCSKSSVAIGHKRDMEKRENGRP